MIASVLNQKKNIPTSFVFLLRKSAFPIGLTFFCIGTKNVLAFFCTISVGITAFLRKIAAVNLNSQLKLYDNSALAVLRQLTTVSAELPATLEQ